jgi:DMSO/TMAO reductase YedYZ molybdopterin-dependent catalytic subunit
VVAYAGVEGAFRVAALSGSDRRNTGSHMTGSFDPDRMPVTQWLGDAVPRIDAAEWSLAVRQAGRAVRRLTLADLERMGEPVRALLDCTGGWFATQDWEGLPIDRLVGASESARSIEVRSVTGYARRFPLSDASRLWIATRAGGRPLSTGHGFPARIVAPGRRGFWWVKWLASVEVSPAPWWLQPPFPLQ